MTAASVTNSFAKITSETLKEEGRDGAILLKRVVK